MKKSMCPNSDCLSTKGFEVSETKVTINQKRVDVPLFLIQCKNCGTVVGTEFKANFIASAKILK